MAQIAAGNTDVLVLGGGGILGEAWMIAVLAALQDEADLDARACRMYVGTSAGSIVAASLAAGVAPKERLGSAVPAATATAGDSAGDPAGGDSAIPPRFARAVGAAGRLARPAALGASAAAPLMSFALRSSAPGGALLRRGMLRGVAPGRRSLHELGHAVARSGVRFDGRLRIVAVELASGRRVVFGAPSAPIASVADAVCASCAIPGVFEPVEVDGRAYVDGGAWSPTNLDAAEVSRGDRVLCLNPTGSLRPTREALAGAIGPVSRGIAGGEALALRHRGASVLTINPDARAVAAMGTNLMDPRLRAAVIDAGLAQGRALAAAARGRAA
jgi:NTE family protein